METETQKIPSGSDTMNSLVRHKSGLETFEENGISVMRCPTCGTENEWPYDDGGNEAECYGGCGKRFAYDQPNATDESFERSKNK